MALKLGELQVDITGDTTGLKKAEKEVNRTAENTTKAFRKVGAAITAAISFEAARRVIMIADNMKVLERRLIRITGDAKSAARSMEALVRTSNDIGATIQSTTKIFERFSLIRESLGATNQEILDMTDTLSKMGALGGSTADEIDRALVQLAQGLSGAKITAEEYNSILDSTPEIIKNIGLEMGFSMGEVRKAMLKGELTSSKVFAAIQSSAERVNEEFADMPKSIGMAAQALQNELAISIKNIDENLGLSDSVSQSISKVAELLEGINKATAQQRQLDELITGERVRGNTRGRGGKTIYSDDVKDAIELKRLTEENIRLLASLDEKVNRTTVRRIGTRTRNQTTQGSKTAEERAPALEQIRLNEIRINQLREQSETAKKVSDILTGADEPEGKAKASKKTPLTDAQSKRVAQIKLLGETEREEVARIAEERKAFVLNLDQIEADERNLLLESIEAERLSRIKEINEQEIDEERRKAEEKLSIQKEAIQEQISLVNMAANSISNIVRATGDNQAAAFASIINQVAGVATTIATIMQAQAASQALADPTAVTTLQKIANVSLLTSQFVGIFSAIKGAKGGGRQFGGGTSASMAHPINETGAPEVLTQGTRQYLLPNGKTGKVSPLGAGGGGGGSVTSVAILNQGPPMNITGTSIENGTMKIMIDQAIRANNNMNNSQIASGRGETFNAMQKSMQVKRNL